MPDGWTYNGRHDRFELWHDGVIRGWVSVEMIRIHGWPL